MKEERGLLGRFQLLLLPAICERTLCLQDDLFFNSLKEGGNHRISQERHADKATQHEHSSILGKVFSKSFILRRLFLCKLNLRNCV